MGIKAKLLLLVALMVGIVSVVAQVTITEQPATQPHTDPSTCPPVTQNTCQVLQGPPGHPGTCSYTEVSLVKGARNISTSLKEAAKNLTKELRESSTDLRETLQGGLQRLNGGLMNGLKKLLNSRLKNLSVPAPWDCLLINQPSPPGELSLQSFFSIRLLLAEECLHGVPRGLLRYGHHPLQH